jgi:hypothetical protein
MVRKDAAAKQGGKSSSAAAVAAPADAKKDAARPLTSEEQDALLASFFAENVYARRAARRSILVLVALVAAGVGFLAYAQHTAPFEGPAHMLQGLRKASTSQITAGLATVLATLLLCAAAAATGSRALLNGALLSAAAPVAVWGLLLTEHGLWRTQPHLYALPLLAPVSTARRGTGCAVVECGAGSGCCCCWVSPPATGQQTTALTLARHPALLLPPQALAGYQTYFERSFDDTDMEIARLLARRYAHKGA